MTPLQRHETVAIVVILTITVAAAATTATTMHHATTYPCFTHPKQNGWHPKQRLSSMLHPRPIFHNQHTNCPSSSSSSSPSTVLFSTTNNDEKEETSNKIKEDDNDESGKRFTAASIPQNQINIRTSADDEKDLIPETGAAINTVNERLMAEIQAAADQEKYGSKSAAGKKLSTADGSNTRPNPFFSKTEEERQRSVEEARDLNGINPLVAIGGSIFAFAGAYGLWTFTNFLAVLFASHPVTTDIYTLQRISAVFRNVVMGLTSLASGFFLVTGLGIFMLGMRVAYGVTTGELDPTPIKKNASEEIVLPNVWELMMGKKPNRRGGGGKNPFL